MSGGGTSDKKPSAQQEAFASANIGPRKVIIARAYAGTGKSFTLRHLAARNPGKRFLYLVFGAKNAAEAVQSMPNNVECTTVHGLAHKRYGKAKYRDAGKLDTERKTRSSDVAARFNCSITDGWFALSTVHAYLNTTDPRIGVQHVPADFKGTGNEMNKLIMLAERVLSAMQNVNDKQFLATDDLYLKEWLLTKPVLTEYDCILVDEAQDSNALTIALIRLQLEHAGCAVVLVGDNYQNIFAFRRTVNALKVMDEPGAQHYILSESYRYPAAIGRMATAILKCFYNEQNPVVGKAPTPEPEWLENAWARYKAWMDSLPEARRFKEKPPKGSEPPTMCMLSRTNSTLIRMAMAILARNPKAKFHFAGTNARNGWSPRGGYGFTAFEDACALALADPKAAPPKMKSDVMKPYTRWKKFLADAEDSPDPEIAGIAKLVESVGPDKLPAHLAAIEAAATHDKTYTSLSTAHRSKGLEWDRVKVLGDFPDIFSSKTAERLGRHALEQEANLLYVAVTRARKEIEFSKPAIAEWMERNA